MQTHSAAPWTFRQLDKWPFQRVITDANGIELLKLHPIACSTSSKTLEAHRAGDGFTGDQRSEVVEALATERANLRMMAAAPKLLAALIRLRQDAYNACADSSCNEAFDIADAAIDAANGTLE